MIVLRLTFEVRSELGMACMFSSKLEGMLADILPRYDAQDNKVGYNSSHCLGMSLRHDLRVSSSSLRNQFYTADITG
jgi:hypothetical protein